MKNLFRLLSFIKLSLQVKLSKFHYLFDNEPFDRGETALSFNLVGQVHECKVSSVVAAKTRHQQTNVRAPNPNITRY